LWNVDKAPMIQYAWHNFEVAMSAVWTAAVVFVLTASLCFRVLIITRYRERVYTPEWLGPALFGLMLVAAGFILITALLLPSSRSLRFDLYVRAPNQLLSAGP
jgi:hypothetical protein